jgi:cytochrome c-type biogenesis protein CcmH/NrfF
MRSALIAACTFAIVLALAGPAWAVEPRTTLPDVEDEVMCVECKTPLNLSTAAVADRERAFIRREIARGKTKEQIKDELVDRFGPAVLATPEDKGFGLTAYWVPVLVILFALAGVLVTARRWRRPARAARAAPEPDPAELDRLDRELARFDGD